MEPRTEPRKADDSATSTTPRIVNGIPFRPRETINVWEGIGLLAICVLPGVVSLLVIVPLAVRATSKYFDAKGLLPSRPDNRQ